MFGSWNRIEVKLELMENGIKGNRKKKKREISINMFCSLE